MGRDLVSLAGSNFGEISSPISFKKRLILCALCVSSFSSVVKFPFVVLAFVDVHFDTVARRERLDIRQSPRHVLDSACGMDNDGGE